MKNITIGSKISLGFACLFALLLLIALVAVSFTAFSNGNIDRMELYSGLQDNTNELMHILNETRVTAGAFYATHAQDTYKNVQKQIMYCDKRLEKLYQYIDAHEELKDFRARVGDFDALYGAWRDGMLAMAGRYDFQEALDHEQEEAFAALAAELRATNLRAHELLSQLGSDIVETSGKITKQTKEFGSAALLVVIAISAVALLSSIAIAVLLIRSITRPIGRMRDVLIQIGQYGDLRLRADAETELRKLAAGKDETAQCTSELLVLVARLEEIDRSLSHVANGDLTAAPSLMSERDTIGLAVVRMLENLNQKFGTIADSTLQVNAKTRELSEDSRLLASGSQEQTNTISHLSNSVKSVSQKTEENSVLARRAADLTDHIRSTARVGTEKMNQMIQATEDISTANKDIIKVIRVIDDIAFQTNILALNASVEAARAGQNGMGFAVVADEVRDLANKSAVAAKETGALIEDSVQKAALGASIAKATSASLQEIVTGVEDSNAIMSDITAFSHEQSSDIMKIVEDVRHVEQIVEQNNAIATRSANAATDISDQSDLLQGMVAQFTLANKALGAPRAPSGNNRNEVGIHG